MKSYITHLEHTWGYYKCSAIMYYHLILGKWFWHNFGTKIAWRYYIISWAIEEKKKHTRELELEQIATVNLLNGSELFDLNESNIIHEYYQHCFFM